MKEDRPIGSKDQLRPRLEAPPVMTVIETCDHLHIVQNTLYRLIQQGEIPYFKIGTDSSSIAKRSMRGCKGQCKSQSEPQSSKPSESEKSLIVPRCGAYHSRRQARRLLQMPATPCD
jgi:excisionase family DNA binding protein